MNQVKLVIWDLDETFWKGTLSEAPIELIPDNVKLIKTLVSRGIMCSISSKNDIKPAKAELEKAGVWDLFVFPIINWNPKGENIRRIISRCQLRPVNVLFIDDNISNRKEAEFYNPGIMTMDPIDLPHILNEEGFVGKDDSKLSRLKQYKILEQKELFKNSCSDNTDFLIKSNIQVEFIRDIKANSVRLAELIARSNQLNFTKIRIDESGVLALAYNPSYECAAIHVIDNFGDYGICGFYALEKAHKKLEHFLFSCRILNLGVENFVFQHLGCPQLDIIEPVSETINPERNTSYITLIEGERRKDKMKKRGEAKNKKKILLLGGCDLSQLESYLPKEKIEILTDFNYVNTKGINVHREHTVYLRGRKEYCTNPHLTEYLQIPFHDSKMLEYSLEKDYDVIVYSVLMNYTQNLYYNRDWNMFLAQGGYNNILEKNEYKGFSKEQLELFKKCWKYIGQQSPSDFIADLEYLLSQTDKPILLLNGAEVEISNPREKGATERHRMMNDALAQFVARHPDRAKIIDVRRFVKSNDDVTDNIRHYKRFVYYRLANEIENAVLYSDSGYCHKFMLKVRRGIILTLKKIKVELQSYIKSDSCKKAT